MADLPLTRPTVRARTRRRITLLVLDLPKPELSDHLAKDLLVAGHLRREI